MVHQSKQKDIPQTPTIGGAAEFVLPVPAATSEPMSLITMLNASGPTQPLRAPTPQLAFAQDPIGRQPSPATPTTPTFPMGQFWSPQAAPISQMSLSIPDNNTYDTDKKKKLAPMHVLEMELDSPSEEPRGGRKGRKYCFFFKNRTNVYICGLISLIILIIMIIVGVLYYPRSPQFKVLSLKTLRSGGQIPLKFVRKDPKDPLNFTLTFDLTMNVSFYNENRYAIGVDELDLSAYLAPNVTMLRGSDLGGTEKLKAGSTVPSRRVGFSRRNDLNFPSYKNTTFIMNITLFYAPDPKTGLFGDIVFSEFFQACGLAKTPKRKLNIDYTIGIAIPFFMALGIKPSLNGESGIDCPFDLSEMERIISQLSNPNGAAESDTSPEESDN